MFLTRLKVATNGTDLTCIREQPERSALLHGIERMRLEGATKDAEGFGRWALSIPFEDYVALGTKYPALMSKDPREKQKFYRWFMQSDESLPYRVREKI